MEHAIAKLMRERIASGLKRKSVTSCSKWAETYRFVDKPYVGNWSFKYLPWQRGMHDSDAPLNVGQKSAQAGYTETVLNRTFYMIDVKGVDCLYVLPSSTPDASDFSASRFDAALELSPHLTNMFSDVKNIGHKRAGSSNLYIRGSRSRSQLKSIPVGFIVLDELDEMEQDNIPLALQRTAGQFESQVWMLSTPTIPDEGINKFFKSSNQEHFFFRCPGCSRLIELMFPECLIITADNHSDPKIKDSYVQCKECKYKFTHEEKHLHMADGVWVPQFAGDGSRGFYVNQLYSTTVHPSEIAKSYLQSEYDPFEEQEFWNSRMGTAHTVKGAGVSDEDINNCIAQPGYARYTTGPKYGIVTMGVDVGKWIHYEIDTWKVDGSIQSNDLNIRSKCKVLTFGRVQHFEELDILMRKFGINACVIDSNPERRKAHEFANRFPGLVKMCIYGNNINGKRIHIANPDETDEPRITVDRTSWLDLSLGRFRGTGMILLPMDLDYEYRTHIKALVRVYDKDKNDMQVARYKTKGNEGDHYGHARNYAEIALPFALSLANPQDIRGVY